MNYVTPCTDAHSLFIGILHAHGKLQNSHAFVPLQRVVEVVVNIAYFLTTKLVFFKAFNSIYGKIGRSASEEVTFELIKSKRLSYQFLCME